MDTHFPAFPHLYDPPGDVVRCLREIDPAADLLYMGWGTWYLVRFRPNRQHTERAIAALRGHSDQTGKHVYGAIELLALWDNLPRLKANPAAFRRLYQRFLFWTAVRLGARPIGEYRAVFIRRFGLSAIVDDFRQAEWKARHLSDAAVMEALDAPKERERAEARAELSDEHAAVTMANHLIRAPHSVTAAAPELGRSGFRRHPRSPIEPVGTTVISREIDEARRFRAVKEAS